MTMLKKILEVDPAKRLTPIQILSDPWMQLSAEQEKLVEVFTTYEKEKIVSEFEYYNVKEEGGPQDDPFLEVEL